MKELTNFIRVVTGLLFIFSGLVKAIDPLGLSYKMQEFFELWGLTSLNSFTLWLSILMIAFEIIAGMALLLGWRMKLFIWLLLLLILFFTFLTGYAYLSGKFKNCGCFGDCIPITPLTSFLKDIILTLFIFFLFANRNRIPALLSPRVNEIIMTLTTIFSFGLQWYALQYLPPVDCLPFKKGNNITEKMQIPAGALPDSFAIRFVYEKAGKQYEFAPSDLPADLDSYNYVSRTDKLIRKGNAEPPIKGFALSGVSDVDSTAIVLAMPHAILLFDEKFATPVKEWESAFSQLYGIAGQKGIPVFLVTNRPSEAASTLAGTSFANIPVFKCDYTTIRTAARTSPTVYLLRQGTIVQKESYRRMAKVTAAVQQIGTGK